MGRHFFLFMFLAVVFLARATAVNDMLEVLKTKTAKYCGRNLSEVLSFVCEGRYNTPQQRHDHIKRDVSEVEMRNPSSEGPFQFPFVSRRSTESFMGRFRKLRRQRRGVYNECCQKPCSYDTLKSYCYDD